MRSRAIYGLAGLVWGLLLGALAAWQVLATAAGLSWLMLFGDEPWPEALGWLIPLIALLAFLGVLAACVALGLRAGRRAERAEPFEARRRRLQGIRLLAVGLLLGLALAAAAGTRLVAQGDERARLAGQSAWFETLLAERQVPVTIAIARAGRAMSYDLRIETTGARGGAYRLTWSLRSSAYEETLAEGAVALVLEAGANRRALAIDAWPILERYHEVALDYRDVDVEVAESFQLTVRLSPELDPDELSRLPPHEAHNLALGQSSLIAAMAIDAPVRFRIGGPEYELLD